MEESLLIPLLSPPEFDELSPADGAGRGNLAADEVSPADGAGRGNLAADEVSPADGAGRGNLAADEVSPADGAGRGNLAADEVSPADGAAQGNLAAVARGKIDIERRPSPDEPDHSTPIHSDAKPQQSDDGRDDLADVVRDVSSGSSLSEEVKDSEERKHERADDAAHDGRDDIAAGDQSGGSRLSGEGDDSSKEKKEKKLERPEDAVDDGRDDSAAAREQSGGSKPSLPSHGGGIVEDRDLGASTSSAANIETLRVLSRAFAESAANSSMASESIRFLRAVEEFDSEEQVTKKIIDTDLSKSGRLLSAAAIRAPPREAALVAVAIKITQDSLDILLSSCCSSDASNQQGSRPCVFLRAWLHRLRTAIFGPEPTLPVHRFQLEERQEKLADKRQAVFGVALAAPLALLTSAASVEVFPSAFGPWIAWVGALLWIAVSCGLLMDLFGKTKWEFQLASCVSRLGMMAVTVLFCLFATVSMWVLVGCAVGLHILLYVLSRAQGGD